MSQLFEQKEYVSRIDEALGGVTYVGLAEPGSLTSDAVWRIKRLVESSGDVTITYADGNSNFDNIWDNRASLTYS